jgi:hypothetical protein
MDNRVGLAQAMAGGQGAPPPQGPRQMQPPDDPLQQILALVMKISDQLDALTTNEQQESQQEAPPQGPPQQ